MVKKSLMIAVLTVCAAGAAFAQVDFDEEEMAKNTVTVDLGPTMTGAFFGTFGNILAGNVEEGSDSFGFGIAAQYERQLSEQFSVAGRFAYLGTSIIISDSYMNQTTKKDTHADLEVDLTSFSVEGHARFYPTGKVFFVDGMLGYANMLVGFSGEIVDRVKHSQGVPVETNINVSQGFVKLGAKVGWRVSFGQNGGFTFETALGYSYGFGLGDTVGQQLTKQMKDNYDATVDQDSFDKAYSAIENIVFIGGPRLVLALGYRF